MISSRALSAMFTVAAATCFFALFMLWSERSTEGFSWMRGPWPQPTVGLRSSLEVGTVTLPNWAPATLAVTLAIWVRRAPRRLGPMLMFLLYGLAHLVTLRQRLSASQLVLGNGLTLTLLAYLAMLGAALFVFFGRRDKMFSEVEQVAVSAFGVRWPFGTVFTVCAAYCVVALPMLWGERPWRMVTAPPLTPLAGVFGLRSSLEILDFTIPNWAPALIAVSLAVWAWIAPSPRGMLIFLLYGLAHTVAMAYELVFENGYAGLGLFLSFGAYFATLWMALTTMVVDARRRLGRFAVDVH